MSFDTVCKYLVEHAPADYASWLLGEPVQLSEINPSELSLEAIRADSLMFLQASNTILHLEWQTRPDAKIPFRMADYRLRLYRRYPDRTVRQIVIYLKPSRSPSVFQTTFEIPNTHHTFEVIRLWEQPVDIFLSSPGLLPLAVLAKTEDKEAVLRQSNQQIMALSDPAERGNMAASTVTLAGLVLKDNPLVQQLLRQDIVQDSVVYQAIKREGLEEGLQRGREEGREETTRSIALRLLTIRLGKLPKPVEQRIKQLSVPVIDALLEALSEVSSLSDLTNWLDQQSL